MSREHELHRPLQHFALKLPAPILHFSRMESDARQTRASPFAQRSLDRSRRLNRLTRASKTPEPRIVGAAHRRAAVFMDEAFKRFALTFI
jgi:hypothetical protein